PRHDEPEALTRSLAQLGDPDYMLTVLQDACDQFAPGAFRVEDYEVEHCKVTPWRDVSLTLVLTQRSTRTGAQSRQVVSGTILTHVDIARRQFEQDRLAAHRIGPLCVDPASAMTALAPDMAMVLRLLPVAPGRPGSA